MSKSPIEYINKNMNKFLDTYSIFEKITTEKGFSTEESIALYAIYMDRSD